MLQIRNPLEKIQRRNLLNFPKGDLTINLDDPRLKAYYVQISQCLMQYGKKSLQESTYMVDNSLLFLHKRTADQVDGFCSESPYFYAKMLLNPDPLDFSWANFKPPSDERLTEDYKKYIKEWESTQKSPKERFKELISRSQKESSYETLFISTIDLKKFASEISRNMVSFKHDSKEARGIPVSRDPNFVSGKGRGPLLVLPRELQNPQQLKEVEKKVFGPDDYDEWVAWVKDPNAASFAMIEGPFVMFPRVGKESHWAYWPGGYQTTFVDPTIQEEFLSGPYLVFSDALQKETEKKRKNR